LSVPQTRTKATTSRLVVRQCHVSLSQKFSFLLLSRSFVMEIYHRYSPRDKIRRRSFSRPSLTMCRQDIISICCPTCGDEISYRYSPLEACRYRGQCYVRRTAVTEGAPREWE